MALSRREILFKLRVSASGLTPPPPSGPPHPPFWLFPLSPSDPLPIQRSLPPQVLLLHPAPLLRTLPPPPPPPKGGFSLPPLPSAHCSFSPFLPLRPLPLTFPNKLMIFPPRPFLLFPPFSLCPLSFQTALTPQTPFCPPSPARPC